MHAFDVLGDPVRRRILELLADGERTAGDVTAIVREEFGISQPGVSQHLRVLRESGLASVRAVGTRLCTRSSPRRCRTPARGSSGSGTSASTRSAPSWRGASDKGGTRERRDRA